jgi:chemotaxis-related protein WspB
MLFVIFSLGTDHFAIDSRQVMEIVPLVPLKRLPMAPEYVAGVFHYRGEVVPVIDLSSLIHGIPSKLHLSTRVMLVSHPGADGRDHCLGLMAERVLETLSVAQADLVSSGVAIPDGPFLGKMIYRGDREGQEMIQCVEPADLLTDSLKAMLFADRKEMDGSPQDH